MERFILERGRGAKNRDLAHVLGITCEEVDRVKNTGAMRKRKCNVEFAPLFRAWHGRDPIEADWPPLEKNHRGSYEWQGPELALCASLVGTMGIPEIASVLTARLRKVTRDRKATRTRFAVQVRIARMGLTSYDIVGGITLSDAGRELGSVHIVRQAVSSKALKAFRVGRLWVIRREEWARWKSEKDEVPDGFIGLGTIREKLGLKSDSKLPEYASHGYIPTAVLLNTHTPGMKSTGRGTWYVDAEVARKMVLDRRRGRPMPWFGKPSPGNLKATWKKLATRWHPESCLKCADIWGKAGRPRLFDDFAKRYPPLDLSDKRHCTRPWRPGLTLHQLTRFVGHDIGYVRRAMQNKQFEAFKHGGEFYVKQADATAWKGRHAPSGDGEKSWISFSTAKRYFDFNARELRAFIAKRQLPSKIITAKGPGYGELYVQRHRCRILRERQGWDINEASRRARCSVTKMREHLKAIKFEGDRIPWTVVDTIRARLNYNNGVTIEQAARRLRVPLEWVKAQRDAGTITLLRSVKDRREAVISEPMLRRLREVLAKRRKPNAPRLGSEWLNCTQAALDAGVSLTTVKRWARDGALTARASADGPRYKVGSVRRRARSYWRKSHFVNPALLRLRPAWLPERRAS